MVKTKDAHPAYFIENDKKINCSYVVDQKKL